MSWTAPEALRKNTQGCPLTSTWILSQASTWAKTHEQAHTQWHKKIKMTLHTIDFYA